MNTLIAKNPGHKARNTAVFLALLTALMITPMFNPAKAVEANATEQEAEQKRRLEAEQQEQQAAEKRILEQEQHAIEGEQDFYDNNKAHPLFIGNNQTINSDDSDDIEISFFRRDK